MDLFCARSDTFGGYHHSLLHGLLFTWLWPNLILCTLILCSFMDYFTVITSPAFASQFSITVLYFYFYTKCLYFYTKCLQILVELISKGGTVKSLIEEKDLVQVSPFSLLAKFLDICLHAGFNILDFPVVPKSLHHCLFVDDTMLHIMFLVVPSISMVGKRLRLFTAPNLKWLNVRTF